MLRMPDLLYRKCENKGLQIHFSFVVATCARRRFSSSPLPRIRAIPVFFSEECVRITSYLQDSRFSARPALYVININSFRRSQ